MLLGLAASAALTAAAFGCGSSSLPDAAACSQPPEAVGEGKSSFLRCSEGTSLASVRLRFALTKGTRSAFRTAIGGVRCNDMHGEAILEQKGGGLTGEVTRMTFGECSETISSCEGVTEMATGTPIEPVEVRYLSSSAPQARLVLRDPNASVGTICALVGEIRCVYGESGALAGTIANPPAQKLRFDATLRLSKGVSSCPEEATVRMVADIRAEELVLEDGTSLEEGSVWVAKEG